MPNAALLVMGSPMLLGPLPPAHISQAHAAAPASVVAAAPTTVQTLLPISWSLSTSQEPPEPTAGEDAQAEPPIDDVEGEIVVEGAIGPPESDPVAEFNETSYRITQDLDDVFLEPVAYAYRDGLPGPIRDGLGNVVRNLSEPANFLNFLMQLKIGDAIETLGRFAINSTLGLGGLIDIAEKPAINLPYRRNGFANTLGYYGVEPGAYLYLPITGATTVRDLIGNSLDQLVLPTAVGKPFNTLEYAVPYFVISNLDARLEVDEELGRIEDTVDPYAARRDTYLARREREIALLRGEDPPEPPAILREIEEGVDDAMEEEFSDEETADGAGPRASSLPKRHLPEIEVALISTKPKAR